jgi:hypothetical protein
VKYPDYNIELKLRGEIIITQHLIAFSTRDRDDRKKVVHVFEKA